MKKDVNKYIFLGLESCTEDVIEMFKSFGAKNIVVNEVSRDYVETTFQHDVIEGIETIFMYTFECTESQFMKIWERFAEIEGSTQYILDPKVEKYLNVLLSNQFDLV